jgi:hypothetical protein
MRYKLVTLPKKTVRIPIVAVPNTSLTLTAGQQDIIRPSTINYADGNSTYGYTAVLADGDVAVLEVVDAALGTKTASTMMSDLEPGQSVSVVGKTFRVRAKTAIASDKTTTLTIYGNETGGQTTVNITVQKQTLNTTPGTSLTGGTAPFLP